jgi:para-aminobenzoate synthetase component I
MVPASRPISGPGGTVCGVADDVLSALVRRLPVDAGCAVVRDGTDTIVAAAPTRVLVDSGKAAFDALREVDRGGFWVGFCAYELGRSVERVVTRRRDEEVSLPDVAFAQYDARLRVRGRRVVVEGSGDTYALLQSLRAEVTAAASRPRPDRESMEWTTSLDRAEHAAAVADVLEHVRAGDCYQVNVTRRLCSAAVAEPLRLFDALDRMNPAAHAALCTFGDALPRVAIVSASPELFFRIDGRMIETRPIKGTGADASTLAASAKDRAENGMIVDLARNDLGRVCEYGSVVVPELCAIEAHPGLYHMVSTVRGRLRHDASLDRVVRALFPPASVTGAPKPRVLQLIEDLEPVPRGVYCGAVGWVDSDRARAEFAVAIRTFAIAEGRTSLGVGGGIVADSRAGAEWDETELKAARLLAAARMAAATTPAWSTVGAP